MFISFESNLNLEFELMKLGYNSEISITEHDCLLYENNTKNIKKYLIF